MQIESRRLRRFAFTMKHLVIVLAITATIVGLAIPVVQKSREADQRARSIHNLKDLALAAHGFHDLHKHLPYNGTSRPYVVKGVSYGGFALPGDPTTGSWAYQILPFLDQNPMFMRRDPNVGVPTFMCPGRGRPIKCDGAGGPGAWTDYFLNSFINDPNGAWDVPDVKRTLVGITDGSSNTILFGQGQIRPQDYAKHDLTPGFTDVIFAGGSASLCRPNVSLSPDTNDSQPGNWGGPFSQGWLFAEADGCVRMFPHTWGVMGIIRNGVCNLPNSLGAYLTPCGGETINVPET